jgi:dolichol-phosphate mannosyltransferase
MLCAYNEEQDIHRLLVGITQVMSQRPEPWRALLVDDGSRDGTVDEARRAADEEDERLALEVLSKPNGGLGSALAAGFSHLLETAAPEDVIVTLDADNTHRPQQIPELLAALEGDRNLSIASRYQEGARVSGVPGYRLLLSEGARWLLAALMPIRGVRDYTCCFRAYRVDLLRRGETRYGPRWIHATGFEAVADILLRLRILGLRAVEIPLELDYSSRVGASKMDWTSAARGLLGLVIRRRFEQWFGFPRPRALP